MNENTVVQQVIEQILKVVSVVEDKKEVLIRKSVGGKGKKLRKTLQKVCNIITNEASQSVSGLPENPNPDFIRVEDLRWQEGGHETMQISESIFPSNIQCKLSFDEDASSPKEVFYKIYRIDVSTLHKNLDVMLCKKGETLM